MNGRFAGLLAIAAVAYSAGSARAQVPYNRPPYSPYLNLLRSGNPAINYYGLVRPQIDFRNSITGLQNQVGTLDRAVNDVAQAGSRTGLPTTGHPTAFLNYSGYFPGLGGRSGGRSFGGSTAAVSSRSAAAVPSGSTAAVPTSRSGSRTPTTRH